MKKITTIVFSLFATVAFTLPSLTFGQQPGALPPASQQNPPIPQDPGTQIPGMVEVQVDTNVYTLPSLPLGEAQEVQVNGTIYIPLTQNVINALDRNKKESLQNIALWKSAGSDKTILQAKSVFAEYGGELSVEETKLFMKTSAGKEIINVMPEEAFALSVKSKVDSVQKLELKEKRGSPIYSINSEKQVKLFSLFPVNLEIQAEIDAQTGGILSIKKPWWSFLTR